MDPNTLLYASFSDSVVISIPSLFGLDTSLVTMHGLRSRLDAQHGVDRRSQSLHAEGHILHRAVQEERRR